MSTANHDPNAWRDRFPILANSTYLVTHSLGAMPKTVYDKLRGYADQWATHGVRAWSEDGWWTSPVDVGNVLAHHHDPNAVEHPEVRRLMWAVRFADGIDEEGDEAVDEASAALGLSADDVEDIRGKLDELRETALSI